MRIVFVTQTVDADDPVLGATVAKLRALAARCDVLHVLALSAGRYELPANVQVATFGASTRPARGLRYARALMPLLRPRPDAILAHMCPIYLVLAAPLARPLRVPLLLWYTHWAAGRLLRVADRLSDAALTVAPSSYPLASAKVRPLGHGVDTELFAPATRPDGGRGSLDLLALGRTSPTKGLDVLVDGFERAVAAGLDAGLELRGASSTPAERRYREELAARIARGPAAGRIRLEEPVPPPEVPTRINRADALLNGHRGTLDKVVYEAAACGVPAVACDGGFAPLLDGLPVELRFLPDDADDLARVLAGLASAAPSARDEAGVELRRRVNAAHSIETWADGVIRAVGDLSPGRSHSVVPAGGESR